MTANKPETALYRAPTFSLLLASHGGIVRFVQFGNLHNLEIALRNLGIPKVSNLEVCTQSYDCAYVRTHESL